MRARLRRSALAIAAAVVLVSALPVAAIDVEDPVTTFTDEFDGTTDLSLYGLDRYHTGYIPSYLPTLTEGTYDGRSVGVFSVDGLGPIAGDPTYGFYRFQGFKAHPGRHRRRGLRQRLRDLPRHRLPPRRRLRRQRPFRFVLGDDQRRRRLQQRRSIVAHRRGARVWRCHPRRAVVLDLGRDDRHPGGLDDAAGSCGMGPDGVAYLHLRAHPVLQRVVPRW